MTILTPSQPAASPTTAASTSPTMSESGVYSQESERLVIAIMMNGARHDLQHPLMALLSPEDFFVDQHQTIWRIIASLRDAGLEADATAIIDQAAKLKAFVGGAPYIIDLVQDPIARMCSEESVTAAAARIKGFSLSRRLQRSLSLAQALNNAGQSFDQVAGFMEDELTNLRRLSSSARSGPRHATVFYDQVMARVVARLDGEDIQTGIPTGFPELDDLLGGGLQNEDVVVLAGRPGMGKTSFAGAIEQNISQSGVPTLFFELEMTGQAIAERKVSSHSRIPLRDIKTAKIKDHDFDALTESLHVLGQAPCYIDDEPGLGMPEIRARARAFLKLHPKAVIFLDYVQIVAVSQSSNSRNPIDDVSRGLKLLARELKCPVVALCQLNRTLETRANKRPIMSDLRESGQIEQDGSVILFVYRDEVYNPDSLARGITEAIVAKNRDGATATVKFQSTLAQMHYVELGIHHGAQE